MRTNRTTLLATLLVAITLLLSLRPAQAQVGQLPAAGASYLAPSTVVAGSTFDSTLTVFSLNPAMQFSAPAAEIRCSKGDEIKTGSETGVTGLNSGEANITPFSRTTTGYVPPSLAGFTCTVTSLVTLGGETFSAKFVINVLPKAFGSIAMSGSSNNAVSGANQKFVAMLTSNVGALVFGEVRASLDCGDTFADNYTILADATPINSTLAFYHAGMPTVTQPLTCTWTGEFDASGEVFQLTQMTFTVVPAQVPAQEHTVGLPLVIR